MILDMDKMAREVAQRVLDEALYEGKTFREWLEIIKNTPPVIRCKACAWRSASGFCGRHGHPVGDDFFCANGTTEIVKKSKPAKKPEKKPEERCGLTDKPCTRCRPDACEHRRTAVPDGSGQRTE